MRWALPGLIPEGAGRGMTQGIAGFVGRIRGGGVRIYSPGA